MSNGTSTEEPRSPRSGLAMKLAAGLSIFLAASGTIFLLIVIQDLGSPRLGGGFAPAPGRLGLLGYLVVAGPIGLLAAVFSIWKRAGWLGYTGLVWNFLNYAAAIVTLQF